MTEYLGSSDILSPANMYTAGLMAPPTRPHRTTAPISSAPVITELKGRNSTSASQPITFLLLSIILFSYLDSLCFMFYVLCFMFYAHTYIYIYMYIPIIIRALKRTRTHINGLPFTAFFTNPHSSSRPTISAKC